MSKITDDEVQKIAQLGRLALSKEEINKATADLSKILAHFAAIQDIETADVSTFDEVGEVQNKTRVDEAEPNALATRDGLLSRAPQVKDDQIQVHAVFREL